MVRLFARKTQDISTLTEEEIKAHLRQQGAASDGFYIFARSYSAEELIDEVEQRTPIGRKLLDIYRDWKPL